MNYRLCIFLMFCMSLTARAQVYRPVLSAGSHATLDSVRILYIPAPNSTISSSAIYVKAEVRITLKPDTTTNKIYLQVLHKQDSSLVYAVNYSLDSAVTGGENGALFFGQGRHFHIICPVAVPLSMYIYKVYTRSAQGSNSSTFITKQ